MARIFVSFHHDLNQEHAEKIRRIIVSLGHTDITVNEGTKIENEDSLTDENIRQKIRDKFLKDVDVTIVVVGSDTTNRKHIDWEIWGTVYQFEGHRQGSIVVVNALTNNVSWLLNEDLIQRHDALEDKVRFWSQNSDVTHKSLEWLPERLRNSIVENYDYESSVNGNYKHPVFPIISYSRTIEDEEVLKLAIKQALDFRDVNKGKWDQSKLMRKNNESPTRNLYEQYKA